MPETFAAEKPRRTKKPHHRGADKAVGAFSPEMVHYEGYGGGNDWMKDAKAGSAELARRCNALLAKMGGGA